MKKLFSVDPLDFKTLHEFRLECAKSDTRGELVFSNGVTVFVDHNGVMSEEPKLMKEQFEALANLLKFQIEKRKSKNV